ncbi:MAG: hypothetical protein HQK57_09375 [Deltaproteobacteria bacterium]|nr:hypothetical protein [Deltaproteobacteria bacterium]MBF0524290.1 hypothetical protein [Deltaproteobacteria bacterium]
MPTVVEEFIEEGFQKGVQEGVLVKAREDIIEGIEIRFGQIPKEVTESISGLSDTMVFKSLLRQAFVSKNLDEFVQALRKSKN